MPPERPWGLVSLDWSTNWRTWKAHGVARGNLEATAVEGCRRVKAASPGTRCFMYRNMELTIEAMESQRAAREEVDAPEGD